MVKVHSFVLSANRSTTLLNKVYCNVPVYVYVPILLGDSYFVIMQKTLVEYCYSIRKDKPMLWYVCFKQI